MSAHLEPAAIVTMAVGLAGPLALAHYGRSPPDRLATPLAVGIAVGTVAAAVATGQVDPYSRMVWYNALLSGLYGLVYGLFGLAGYGVLERLVLPLVSRPGTNDHRA